MENNRAWLSKVAEDLNELQQVPQYANDRIMDMLARIIELLEELKGMQVCLDSGVLVGELAEPMNQRLGTIYNRNNRINAR